MTWRPDDQRGGRRPGVRDHAVAMRAKRVTMLEHRVWMAERIGWPALAESFRRELRAMGVSA